MSISVNSSELYNNINQSVPNSQIQNCPMHDSPFLTVYFLLEVTFNLKTLKQFEFCVNGSLKVDFQPYSTSLEGLQDNKLSVSRSFAEGEAINSLSA